jgi:hypothetical protein
VYGRGKGAIPAKGERKLSPSRQSQKQSQIHFSNRPESRPACVYGPARGAIQPLSEQDSKDYGKTGLIDFTQRQHSSLAGAGYETSTNRKFIFGSLSNRDRNCQNKIRRIMGGQDCWIFWEGISLKLRTCHGRHDFVMFLLYTRLNSRLRAPKLMRSP